MEEYFKKCESKPRWAIAFKERCCRWCVAVIDVFVSARSQRRFHACGFKVLYSTWASRVSAEIADTLLEFGESEGDLKIICLHRDNVFQQMASKMYKETAKENNLSSGKGKVRVCNVVGGRSHCIV